MIQFLVKRRSTRPAERATNRPMAKANPRSTPRSTSTAYAAAARHQANPFINIRLRSLGSRLALQCGHAMLPAFAAFEMAEAGTF